MKQFENVEIDNDIDTPPPPPTYETIILYYKHYYSFIKAAREF